MRPDESPKPLVLPMKGKWYDMILSGEKREEYREFKHYWITRINNWVEVNGGWSQRAERHSVNGHGVEVFYDFTRTCDPMPILFVNGYSKGARRFVGWCDKFTIGVGADHPEWGEGEYDGKAHFVLHISKVERIQE